MRKVLHNFFIFLYNSHISVSHANQVDFDANQSIILKGNGEYQLNQ